MRKQSLLILSFLMIIILPYNYVNAAWGFEIDRIATVSRVIDGDTIELDDGDRVRFGDIDTPETHEMGYQEAKDYVKNKIEGKLVYLDIDDFTRTDRYGRLVCVVYFEYNSTHYENLNKALLDENLASIWDFENNDFNPYLWARYVSKDTFQEVTPSPTSTFSTPIPTWTIHLATPIPTLYVNTTNQNPFQQFLNSTVITLTIIILCFIGRFFINRELRKRRKR